MLRIGFITIHNPLDKCSFSGSVYHMYRSLKALEGVEVTIACESFHSESCFVQKALRKVGGNSVVDSFRQKLNLKRFLKVLQLESESYNDRYDVLVAPVASNIIGELDPDLHLPPIIFVTDAIYHYLNEEYGWPLNHRHLENEQKTFLRCSRVVFSSGYMLELAQKKFPEIIDSGSSKFVHFPFGLNLDVEITTSVKIEPTEFVNLVFISSDWNRKGGDVVIDALDRLNHQGVNARLTIIGDSPRYVHRNPNIQAYSYVDKNSKEGLDIYSKVLREGHFLLLPSKADCTPMVIAEANAFGLPAIASSVGGIPSLVVDGLNGVLMSPQSTGNDYAEVILSWINTFPGRYEAFSLSSREAYELRLNWNTWAKNIVSNAHDILGQHRGHGAIALCKVQSA